MTLKLYCQIKNLKNLTYKYTFVCIYGYLFTYTYMSVHLVYKDVVGLPWF